MLVKFHDNFGGIDREICEIIQIGEYDYNDNFYNVISSYTR